MNAEQPPSRGPNAAFPSAREAGLRALVEILIAAGAGPDEIARQLAVFEKAWTV